MKSSSSVIRKPREGYDDDGRKCKYGTNGKGGCSRPKAKAKAKAKSCADTGRPVGVTTFKGKTIKGNKNFTVYQGKKGGLFICKNGRKVYKFPPFVQMA